MSDTSSIEELFPGTDAELCVVINWFSLVGSQIQLMTTDIKHYCREIDHAPTYANMARQDAKSRASWICGELSEWATISAHFSADVKHRVELAIFAMIDATYEIAQAATDEAFERGVDSFIAVSGRYQQETKSAVKLIAAVISRRQRAAKATGQNNSEEHSANMGHLSHRGKRVAPDEHAERKRVYERWLQFRDNYEEFGYSRCSYANFASWACDEFDDMPSDDAEILAGMIEAYRKTPDPKPGRKMPTKQIRRKKSGRR